MLALIHTLRGTRSSTEPVTIQSYPGPGALEDDPW